jgi:hypothetical protein
MDLVTLTVGFVIGAFTGAAGQYLGAKYTDQRRAKEASSIQNKKWADLEMRFPNVIREMKKDVQNADFLSVREFFVKNSRTTVNRSEPFFEYHTDIHSDISAAVQHLVELGYIVDITPGNCPMYRMKEHFIDQLRRS